MHRAVSRLLGLLAEDKPLVLVLDDLHWSDGASVELLAALARREPDAAVLVALGFRPGPVAQRLHGALTGPRVRRLRLEPLTQAEATQLLEHLDAERASAIYRYGGGNPFFLEQLGRVDGGATASQVEPVPAAPDAVVPPAVAAAIAAELGTLTDGSRTLLNAAAVAGEPFELDLAAAIAGMEANQALTALDDLLDADLIRPTQVPRRFVFRHPLVRRAVYESQGVGRRLDAHARAAEALAARGADAGERAHHVEQSAAQGDAAAIELLLDAGRQVAPPRPAHGRALVRGGPAAASQRRLGPPGLGQDVPGLRACVREASSSAAAPRCSRRSSFSPRSRPSAGSR